MHKKTIYLMRHGETELNRLRIVQGSGVDAHLNDTGRQQAMAFFEFYRDEGFEVVLTSRLTRTHQTVAPFLDMGLPWEQFEWLNEMNWGRHEGQPNTPELHAYYEEVIRAWKAGDYHVRFADGENAVELAGRLQDFVHHLRQRPEQKILVCSHGRALRCLICLLKGEPLHRMEDYHHANTGVYVVNYEQDTFFVELENDRRHLQPAIWG